MGREVDKNLYNEKSLYLLNIKELRDMGRKFGVPAPTTLSKQKLVDYILKIVYGEIETTKHNSYGRPNVRKFDMNRYVSKIKNKSEMTDELKKFKLEDVESIFKVASGEHETLKAELEYRIFVEDEGKFFLRKKCFVKSADDLEVSENLVKKYGLENNDVVEIISNESSFKIQTINGESVNPQKGINDDKHGKKEVFHLRTKEEIKLEIAKLSKKCEANKEKLLIFSNENYDDLCAETIVVEENEKESQVYKKLMTLIGLCEKYVFENEDIVVAVEGTELIEKTIDSFDDEVSNRTKKYIQEKVNSFLALGNTIYIYNLENAVTY